MDILPLLKPRSVAIIGASRDTKKIGAQITHNLLTAKYEGDIYPINLKAETVQGIKAFSSITEIKETIDLAIVAIPKQFVLDAVKQCIEKKAGSIVIISAGFKEINAEGAALEKEIAYLCKKAGIPLLGPNCLGLINPSVNLNASFTAQMPAKGNVTFISQSGAFGTAAIDWAASHNIGFDLFISLGNKAVLNESHFLQTVQPETKVIAMYLEDITHGEQFLDLALNISKTTPILLLKPGKSKKAQEAAKSHTGALTGSDTVVSTACKQVNIVRTDTSQDLFDLIKAFSFLNEMKGNKIAIITNAGGPSIMATDTLELSGLELASLPEQTQNALKQYLPAESNIHNPVDLIGDATAERYDHALEILLSEKNVDACVVILTPQSATEIELTATSILKHATMTKKPIVAVFSGGSHIEKGVKILNHNHIPCYEYPEQAVHVLGKVWEYYKNLEKFEMAIPRTQGTFIPHPATQKMLQDIQQSHRTALLQDEIENLFKEVNLHFPSKRTLTSREGAYEKAMEIGTPVVMKISSPNIVHKTDMHAVALNLHDQEEIEDTFDRFETILEKNGNIGSIYIQKQLPRTTELLLGLKRDPTFGPVIVFGSGGIYTEIYRDTASRIAPISRNNALDMINETKIAKILNGFRGEEKHDLAQIVHAITSFSNLAQSYPNIVEIDINPLVLVNDTPLVIDARVIVSDSV